MTDALLDALNQCHPILSKLDFEDRADLLETLTRLYILGADKRAKLLAMLEAEDVARAAWSR
jgi:hypothetical protein